MTTSGFERPGTLPRPGLQGRATRILFGIASLAFFGWTLANYTTLVSSGVPNVGWWIGAGWGFYLLTDVINIGFTRTWGRWPQLVVLLLALAAVALDLSIYGGFWGPPLGLLVFLLLAFVFGPLGLSFILSAIFATPG
jgi:hypothetical protein